MNKTQTSEVLEYLKQNKEITSWQAINMFGATRLSDIIYRLRKKGYNIKSEQKMTRTRYGTNAIISVYTLEV